MDLIKLTLCAGELISLVRPNLFKKVVKNMNRNQVSENVVSMAGWMNRQQ